MKDYIGKEGKRIVFSIAIPGFIALLPWAIITVQKFNLDDSEKGSSILSIALILFSIAAGLLMHDIGSRLEVMIDQLLIKFKFPEFQPTWDRFLSLRFEEDNQPIRLKYISELVDRFRFELNSIPSFIFSWVGFHNLSLLHNWDSSTYWYCIVLSHVFAIAYLLVEVWSSANLLHKQRVKLLADEDAHLAQNNGVQ